MSKFALIDPRSNRVCEIQDPANFVASGGSAPQADQEPFGVAAPLFWVDVTGMIPMPDHTYTYVNGAFVAPNTSVSASPLRKGTQLV